MLKQLRVSYFTAQTLSRIFTINVLLADQALVSGVNFGVGILLARKLGISGYGIYNLAWMFVLVANSLQMALISSPMASIGPKQKPEDSDLYFSAIFIHQIIFTLLCGLIIFVCAKLCHLVNASWGLGDWAPSLSAAAMSVQLHEYYRRFFFTTNQINKAFKIDFIRYTAQLIILAVFYFSADLDINTTLWSVALSSLIGSLLGARSFRRYRASPLKSTASIFVRNWTSSRWLVASAILQWISGNWFIVAAGIVLGPVALGALRASQNIVGILNPLLQTLENMVPIKASRIYIENGIGGLARYIIKITLFGGGVACILIALIFSMSDFILESVYGHEYKGYGHVLTLFGIVYILVFIALPVRSFLRTIEHTMPIFLAYAITSVFSVTFADFIVNKYQLEGVLGGIFITQLLSNCVAILFAIFFYRKESRRARISDKLTRAESPL